MGNELTTEHDETSRRTSTNLVDGPASLCTFCSTLNFPSIFYTSDALSQDWNWTLAEILRSSKQCPFCLLIIRCITHTPDLAGNPLRWLDDHDEGAVFCVFVKKKIGTVAGDFGHEQHVVWINVFEKGISRPGPGFGVGFNCGIQIFGGRCEGDGWGGPIFTGRMVNERQTEYALVRKWMEYCPMAHGGRCGPSAVAAMAMAEGFRAAALRFIDVSQGCIVMAPLGDCKYFALSYVWGRVRSLQLTKANYAVLTQPGALSKGAVDLPATITDAIYLVRKFGEVYLWVDSLCVIQDSDEDKAVQIANMDAVYQNAFLTIVAAAGRDADAGLPGVRPNSRITPQVVQDVGNWSFCNVRRQFHWEIPDSVWSTRGWTFQEKVLSPRRLVFSDAQTYFECDGGTWCEDTVFEPVDTNIHKVQEFGAWMKNFPINGSAGPFSRYTKFVEEYSHRDLSFQKDAIDAFAGILSMLQPGFNNTEYIFGLPETVFHTALLWDFAPLIPIIRRDHSTMPGEEKIVELKYPSWSWIAWQVRVEYKSPKKGTLEEHTVPLVSIYKWRICSSEQQVQESLYRVNGFDDDNMPADRKDVQQAALKFPQDPTLLYFFTFVARFRIDTEPWDTKWKSDPNIYRLRSRSGEEAGELLLPGEWHNNHQEAECVLLSRDTSDTGNSEIFLNILVVDLKERDVACRVAKAKVSQKHWDEAGPVQKFVCLG